MALKSEFKGRPVGGLFICAIVLCLLNSLLFAQQPDANSQAPRYRIFALKHITGQRGQKYLEDIQIGTVSQLPANPNTLLVTASQADLIKVTSILNLVDANEEYTYGVICPASELSELPSNKQLEKAIGNISVGTLFDPPTYSVPVKAIVDIHKDKIIVLGPAAQFEKIASAVRQFKKSAPQAFIAAAKPESPNKPAQVGKPTETKLLQAELVAVPESKKTVTSPNKPAQVQKQTENGPDDLFAKLVSTIDEAEKKATEKALQPERPNQPFTGVLMPKTSEPNVSPAKIQKPYEPNLAAGAIQKSTEPNLSPLQLIPQAVVKQPTDVNQTNLKVGSGGAQKASQVSEHRSYEPEPNTAIANETLDLNLPERLNIVDLLGLVGEYMHLDYMYDPDKVRGEVTLKLRGPIKVKELYPLLESVLKFRGFAMTRKGNLVTIVPSAEALDIDPTLLKEGSGKVQYGDVVVTRFFDLQYLDTNNAKNLLDGMKLSVNITPIPESGTLIVTGYAYRMSRIDELLDIIDKPGPPKQFRFRPLKYTMATALAPKVKALVEQLGDISITIGASASPTPGVPGAQPRPARGRPQPQPGESSAGGKPAVYLDADERTNRILMIGFDSQLNTVDQLIDSLDVEKQDLRTMRLYDIQRVGAEEVKNKLVELGIIGGDLRTSGYGTTQAARITQRRPIEEPQPQPGVSPAAGGTGISVTEQPVVVIIDSTNSLLVNATPEQHTQIASIIAYVDTETLQMAVPYEIYALENQDPKDLGEVLTKLIQETFKDKEGKIEKVTKKTEEDIIIVPDENTFSLIVYASRKNQEWIKKLITSLDKRRPQVLIDVTLVEITRDDSFNYDLNIVTAAGEKMSLVTQNSLLPALTKTPTNKVEGSFNSLDSQGSPTGKTKAFYNDSHVQALLTAMQTKSYGRVLAKPKILVDDGSEGNITTKNTTSYQKSTVQLSGAQAEPITSTDFVTVDATIELKITPHISEGELLRLEISMSRDDFGSRPITNGPPDKTSSMVKTTVFVPDDKTVILGGLVKLNQSKGDTRVPILGDIPLVGGLFRSVNNSDVESKLYVFLKANVIRPYTEGRLRDLQEMSQKHREAFEKGEKHFQKKEDWPGIGAKPMEPKKVLDEL